MTDLFSLEPYNLLLLFAGFITLLAATIPNVFHKSHITAPVIYMGIGVGLYFLGSGYSSFDVMNNVSLIRRLSEFVVIVSLTNAGLKIKKPFQWQTWKHAFWLLVITMPLTIIASAFVSSWILGLVPATAILFGAVIAPTDPVLASDLQTSIPSKNDISKSRLGLTAEAGLNDGLAFPFTYFAIFMVSKGADYDLWLVEWLTVSVLYKIVIGSLIGWICGWLLYKLIFKMTSETHHSKISLGILSISLTLLPYAIAELFGSYGFIAVFIAACVFSRDEKKVKHMDNLHDFTEEVERIFVALLFVFVGIYVSDNITALLDFKIVATALIVLFVIRPLSGWLALSRSTLNGLQKFVLSFYGIRGVGSIFYLMYAFSQASFEGAETILHVTALTILISVLIHGLTAATIQKRLLVNED